MSGANWNDLQYLLAVSRRGTITGAARLMAVDATTVSRRIAALEARMNTRLMRRLSTGRQDLTKAGEKAVRLAQTIEQDLSDIGESRAADQTGAAGTVRLTSVPIVINRLLAPALPQLLDANPHLQLELIADQSDFSLTRREADMAIRLARPRFGGHKVKTRRIGELHYLPYRAADANEAASSRWIAYDDTSAHLPQARWIEAQAGDNIGIRVNDNETAYQAVLAGQGATLLPSIIADQDNRLVHADVHLESPPVTREVWLLVHADLAQLARISAVSNWIEDVMAN